MWLYFFAKLHKKYKSTNFFFIIPDKSTNFLSGISNKSTNLFWQKIDKSTNSPVRVNFSWCNRDIQAHLIIQTTIFEADD